MIVRGGTGFKTAFRMFVAKNWVAVVVVLAAGQGTRMKSALAKVLHPLCGIPLLGHMARVAEGLGAERLSCDAHHLATQATHRVVVLHHDLGETDEVGPLIGPGEIVTLDHLA